MPAHVFYSNNYDALIASRKLDDTLMSFDVQECNMENQFKLVIYLRYYDYYCLMSKKHHLCFLIKPFTHLQ